MEDILILGVLIGGLIWWASKQDEDTSDNDTQNENIIDSTMTALDAAKKDITTAVAGPGPVDDMSTSQAMLDVLMAREAYRGTPYQVPGEQKFTWGYGHQGQDGETPPDYISQADAAALFAQDVVSRGETWVKQYVTVALTQNQFDALVSIAFNMSPQSFKKFAASVNDGNGIDGIAQDSVSWVNDSVRRGIQNRRNFEMQVFDTGNYTA